MSELTLTTPLSLHEKLAALTATPRAVLELRNATSQLLRQHIKESRSQAEAKLLKDGSGTRCAAQLSQVQDEIIGTLFDLACKAHGITTDLPVAVIAVGGYGRGTLAPGSDIDLLFAIEGAESGEIGKVIEFILYALWDARQKVGHSTRSVADCITLAKSDSTILTAMLEARFLCGDQILYRDFNKRFRGLITQKNARNFVSEKLAERDSRHAKDGTSRYAVEPDLKDGKGGLRDLHTLFWIAKFLFNAQSVDELVAQGVFKASERRLFQKCEDFLWAVRCHLHFIAGRAEDKLSFDFQAEMAERLGYRAGAGLNHIERFMKHYFLVAREVGLLTRVFCASLEARHLKDSPSLSRTLKKFLPRRRKTKADGIFVAEHGRLTLAAGETFSRDPLNMIRIFEEAAKAGADIHPDALKDIRLNLRAITNRLREDTRARESFLSILTESDDPETVLRAMNEAGVLGRFIPEFGTVVAMMQFNMYHHYTVDEHLIRTVGVMKAIERGEIAEDHPLATKLFPSITSRRALYVAALLHDIGKGRTEDHSILGERLSRSICARLGLTAEETETVAWLVRHHLVMSETSQMRDLNDFKTILDFAKVVQSPERLKLLLILTVADIRAVGPGVWNAWKGQLLRTLYAEAEPLLTGGHTAQSRASRVEEAQALYFARSGITAEDEKAKVRQRHYEAYWLTVPVEQQLRHEAMIKSAAPREVTTMVTSDAFTGVTEITVYVPDHPRLLASITGACAAVGGNIIGAQIFTTTEGMALDTILLRREFKDDADEDRRAKTIADTIAKVLRGQIRLKDALAKAPKPEFRVAAFQVEPRVIIDNASSNRQTVIEINGRDRVGLLHDLTDALFQLNLNIASAHVTTFGEKAIDVFYVTDLTGAKIESESRHKKIETALLAVLNKV